MTAKSRPATSLAVRVSDVIVLTLLILAAACGGDAPSRAAFGPERVNEHIYDGARQGNPHFYFLPPIVSQPTTTGVTDANASPTVMVCDWLTPANGAARCGNVMAQFTLGGGSGSESIRYDATSQSYIVNWHTDTCITGACTLDPTRTYRVRVLVGGTELGHADVDVVSSGKELKNVETQEYVPLLNGRTLPLKFRIEQGAVALLAPGATTSVGSAGGEIASSDGLVALSFPSGALTSSTPISIDPLPAPLPGTGAWSPAVDLGPDGSTFSQPVTLSLGYDLSKLPTGVIPEALKLSTWVNDHWEEVPGSTLNTSDATVSAPITHFSTYALAIWPNAVSGNPSASQLYTGQQTTFSGRFWYWVTQPAQYCYWTRVHVSGWFGGYWTYYQTCYTYTTTQYYYPSGVAVYWSSSSPAVASVGAPGYSLTTTNGNVTSPAISALSVGSTVIKGAVGSIYTTSPLTVLPSLVFDVFGTGTSPFRKFGFGQGTGMNVRIPSPLAANLSVSFTHSNPAVAGSNSSLVILAGTTQNGLTIGAGSVAGRDTLIGTAPGFGADTLVIETGPGKVFVENWPTSLAYGDSAAIRIRPMNQDSTVIDNAWNTTFALASNGSLAFSYGNAAITSIAVPNGSSSTPVFYVKAIAPGAATMTVTHPNFVNGQYQVTVAPPPFTTIQVQPTPTTVRPGQTVQLTATALTASSVPVSGVAITWTSSNAALSTVSSTGLVTGVANGTVTITAASGGVSGTATVYVGTPTIGVTPSSLTIPVQQGQVNQATISITNAGTGLLTGLTTGPLSNYFNGSPAPWATATLSSTTAPATLTITAAPGLSIPAGVHQLRFDLLAPGATNSPVTFYSINITVIAAGVTPVNATISPSPTSLSFSVVQGQSASRTIAINNSGTDPLTNLTVGSFSNYFNGSPAPWVTATVSPTTAPATITITANPGLSIPPGTNQLRFEVASPGATNSPFTFYSINVTVIAAPPDPTFSLSNLGTLGGSGNSEALAINGSGRIVGVSNQQGFWMDPSFTAPSQVPNPIGDIWWAYDVNASGVIAVTQPYQGWTWNPATSVTVGPPPGPFAVNNRRMVFALNNTGQVLACSDNGAYAQNYVWNTSANSASLITGATNWCYGKINDAGVALASADPGQGGNTRLWYEATQTFTLVPSLGGVTIGRDLNATAVAVGGSQVGGQSHAFRFDPAGGATRDLGTLGGTASEAMGINDNGVIVGWSLNAAGKRRGFIWDPTRQQMFELPPLPGHDESQANDINANGVIVGYSSVGGVKRAVRWTPQ